MMEDTWRSGGQVAHCNIIIYRRIVEHNDKHVQTRSLRTTFDQYTASVSNTNIT